MLNLDTHIVVAFLEGTLRRDETAALERDGHRAVSAIVLWEVEKLRQSGRIRFGLDDAGMRDFLSQVDILPITIDIARASQLLDFQSDPADEIIAATSIVHRAPLVTRDDRMLRSRMVPLALG